MLDFARLCKNAGFALQENINMPITQASHEILAAHNISEKTVREMLDIVGEMLRERGLLRKHNFTITSHPEDGAIMIMQPLSAPATLVAEMDWEYAERLFVKIPDAPATVALVGFSMADAE